MDVDECAVWSSFRALRDHVFAAPGDQTEYIVKGQLMHQRRVSRRCSFFDLGSVHSSESTSDRVEILLKIVDGVVSTDDIDSIRHEINVGDIVHVRCLVEKVPVVTAEENNEDSDVAHPHQLHPLLLHARGVTTVTPWKETNPGIPFVPVPTVHTKKKKKTEASANTTATTAASSFSNSNNASERQHCKFWLNTGSCQNGDQCEHYHVDKSQLKAARAQWLQDRLKRRREKSSQDADPHDAHGKSSKSQRAGVFVQWLVDTFGAEYLSSGAGVVDVAGGRGNVSFDLWNKRKIPSILVEPRPMKLSRDQHKHFKKLKLDQAAVQAALVPQKLALFNTTTFLEDPTNAALVRDASVLVGMHPDEATDAILDVALQFGKPFAVVPCCVFSHSFPERRLPNGTSKVLCYEDLVQYLLAKCPSIQKGYLPFDGKNLVLFRLSQKDHTGDAERPPTGAAVEDN